MENATGSQSYIAITKQDPATPRVIPTSPIMQKVNFEDEDLKRTNKTKKSAHVRDDRMNNGLIIQGFDVGGGYNFEFTYENSLLDELLAAFLWAQEWSAPQVDLDFTGGSFALTGSILDLTAAVTKPVVVDGQKLRITGTANNGENDGVYTLTETATNLYTVVPPPKSNEIFAAESVLANGSMIRNGKFNQPFFIERGHVDVQQFFKFWGMAGNVLSLDFKDQSDIKGSFQFIGLLFALDQAVETGATYTGLTQNPILSTSINVKTISIDGVIQAGCLVKEYDLTLDNKVTAKTGVGVFGACETNFHSIDLGGTMTLYFENELMYNRFLEGQKFSLDWDIIGSDGHGYSFSLPSLQIEDGSVNVTGVDDDVMEKAPYVASIGPLGYMIQIDKF